MAESTRQLNITPEEIESGKTMAFVAYLIFFIPLLMEDMRKNKFVMFHTEQSIVLVIVQVIGWILGTIGSMFCIGVVFYIIVFMIDDLFVFVVAMTTLHAVGIESKYARYSRLIGGLIIFAIGILMLFKPEILMFA